MEELNLLCLYYMGNAHTIIEPEKLFKCFNNPKKRRLLNILKGFPMTHGDLVKVTEMNKDDVKDYLREFVAAGIIIKKIVSHKLRIYMCWYHDTEYIYDDGSNMSEEERKEKLEHNKKTNEVAEAVGFKGKIKLVGFGKRVKRPIQKNTLPGYPEHFIALVFRLFKFDDPHFKKDIIYIDRKRPYEKDGIIINNNKMRALSYFYRGSNDLKFIGDKRELAKVTINARLNLSSK